MKMEEHARAWGHEFVSSILNQSALPAEQRNSLHWEILSHLHEAAERRVEARGGSSITLADLQATIQALGGPEKIASAFLENRVAATPRAGFAKRTGAFLIDALLVGAGLAILINITEVIFHAGGLYHLFEDTLGLAMIGLAFLYFVLSEARYGQTLGKMAFKIKTARVDGRPLEYREAMIRNVAKVVPPLLVADVLFYLLAFRNDDQRGSDRLANTIVIDTTKAVWQPPPAAPVYAPPTPAAQTFLPVDEPSTNPETGRFA